MADKALTVGRLAHSAGVNIETIRYYQRRGLVAKPPRPIQGFRHYPAETVARVRFIKRAQRLGFTLREIDELLRLSDGHCADVHTLAETKCQRIHAQLHELQALYESLQHLARQCVEDRHSTSTPCPIIAALTSFSEPLATRTI